MPSLEDLSRQLIAAVNSDAGYLLAGQWITRRYQELATKYRFRHLRKLGQVYVPAPITVGTITATRDSDLITGDSTATAAWSAECVGKHLRVHNSWYEVIAYQVVSSVGQLRLAGKYGEDGGAGLSYSLVQKIVTLASDVSFIGKSFLNERRRFPIEKISLEELDRLAPSRQLISAGADAVAEISDSVDGHKRVEFYPYSSTSEVYFYAYWTEVPTLQPTSPIPSRMPAHVLIEGGLIDLYRYKMATALDKNMLEAAATWRNEMRTQETKWDRIQRDAVMADRGDDDATFILKAAGVSQRAYDITNAHDYVYNNWPR